MNKVTPNTPGSGKPHDPPPPKPGDPQDRGTADQPPPQPADPQPSPDERIHDPPAPATPGKPGPIVFDEEQTAR